MAEPTYLSAGATFDDARGYRYQLWRYWDKTKPVVLFVMLNPSTADETKLDPTLRRCLGYAQRWGCGGFTVGNLYAIRSTDPAALYRATDPVGRDNDAFLRGLAAGAHFGVIAAWGAHADVRPGRAAAVLGLLRPYRAVYRLGELTKAGHPRHPLYLPGDLAPTPHVELAHG